jgi:hypothetical protein
LFSTIVSPIIAIRGMETNTFMDSSGCVVQE